MRALVNVEHDQMNGVSGLCDLHRQYMEELGLKSCSSAAFKSYVLFFSWNELAVLPYHPILPHHSHIPPFHPSPSEARLDFLRKQLPLHFQPIWSRHCYCLHFRDSHMSLVLPISVVPPRNNSSIIITTTAAIHSIWALSMCQALLGKISVYYLTSSSWQLSGESVTLSKGILTPKSICFTIVGPLVWREIVTSPGGRSGEALEQATLKSPRILSPII